MKRRIALFIHCSIYVNAETSFRPAFGKVKFTNYLVRKRSEIGSLPHLRNLSEMPPAKRRGRRDRADDEGTQIRHGDADEAVSPARAKTEGADARRIRRLTGYHRWYEVWLLRGHGVRLAALQCVWVIMVSRRQFFAVNSLVGLRFRLRDDLPLEAFNCMLNQWHQKGPIA